MNLYLIATLAVITLLFILLKKKLWDKRVKRNWASWVVAVVISCATMVPGYFLIKIINHINPHRWHKIILPLDGHVLGDSQTVEFLLPKGQYIILISAHSAGDDDSVATIEVGYRVTTKDNNILVEGKYKLAQKMITHHSQAFVIENDKTEGEFTATILNPSKQPAQVKVALSTHIFL